MNKRVIKKVNDRMILATNTIIIDNVNNETVEHCGSTKPVGGKFMRKHFARWINRHNVPTWSYGAKFNPARKYYLENVYEWSWQYSNRTVFVHRVEG